MSREVKQKNWKRSWKISTRILDAYNFNMGTIYQIEFKFSKQMSTEET
jgi:hypothetical protein